MDAAKKLSVDIVTASEETSPLAALSADRTLTLNFDDPAAAADTAAAFADSHPLDAVLSVDERTTGAAAAISERLRLKGNSLAAVQAAGNKLTLRKRMRDAGVPSADYRVFHSGEDARIASGSVRYPCVLKPTRLSGSRGVIRADDSTSFQEAFARIGALLLRPEVARISQGDTHILVEDYIPGEEVALDGILDGGRLLTLAVFDKPEPLEGPYFEETIYVTPSRRPPHEQALLSECAQSAARALGLREGPIHAEMRVNKTGPFLLEVAARSIGGLCSRVISYGVSLTLEELILRHSLGMDLSLFDREPEPAGVMMLPIPRTGKFLRLEGIADAIATPGVQDCVLTAFPGKVIEALPEGGEYLGFLFARGKDAASVERSLRKAHNRLKVVYT